MPFDVKFVWRGWRATPVCELEASRKRKNGSWPVTVWEFSAYWFHEFRGVEVLENRQRKLFTLAWCDNAIGRYGLVRLGSRVWRPFARVVS